MHFRVGKSDGVSIEIESWKKILKRNGAKVNLCSGPINIGADYVISNFESQLNQDIFKIDNEAFGGIDHFRSKEELKENIIKQQKIFLDEFEAIIEKSNPDLLIISNIFSVGEGIHLQKPILQVLDKTLIPTIMIHHDFYWENERYDQPSSKYIQRLLDEYFTPKREYIKHFCINSIGQKALKEKKDIDATILYDTFDFSQPQWKTKPKIESFLSENDIYKDDLIILQATRIVRRKNIELAVDFTKQLMQHQDKLLGRKLYNDKNCKRVVLTLAGYVEKRDRKYLAKLTNYAKSEGVTMKYLGNFIDVKYDLFDIYPFSDIVTYPSEYEGFGNQLLETFFARKVPVVFEYPVYKADIGPKGFQIISLGDKLIKDCNEKLVEVDEKVLESAVDEVTNVISDTNQYNKITDKNFDLARKHFSYDAAEEILLDTLSSFRGK